MTAPAYALILPPGFALIPAQGDVEADVRAVVARHYGGQLDDRTSGRVRRVKRSLVSAVSSAKERGIVDVVLPLGVPWRAPVSLALAFAPARREVVEHARVEARDTGAVARLDVELPGDAPGDTIMASLRWRGLDAEAAAGADRTAPQETA